MSDDDPIAICSFRTCVRPRHKVDRRRTLVPGGSPLTGAFYAAGAELTVLILGRLPGLGAAVAGTSPEIRFVVLPLALAYLLARWEIDGRPARAVLRSWLVMRMRPARLVAWRPAQKVGPVILGAITMAPDDRGARLRPAIIDGPGSVLVRSPFHASQRWRTLRIDPELGPPRRRGMEIAVGLGQRIVIR